MGLNLISDRMIHLCLRGHAYSNDEMSAQVMYSQPVMSGWNLSYQQIGQDVFFFNENNASARDPYACIFQEQSSLYEEGEESLQISPAPQATWLTACIRYCNSVTNYLILSCLMLQFYGHNYTMSR